MELLSRNTSVGAVFEKKFNRSMRNSPKRPVSERGVANWIHVIPTITKQYFSRGHSSRKITPIQASLKK